LGLKIESHYFKIPHKYKHFLDDNFIKEGYLVDIENEYNIVLQRVFKNMAKFRAKA